ncbi:MAG TPA: hypothetical protein VFT70_06915 [Nocardioides sp.]|nr:hypothetical protein [Nocardioides sp.]
MSLMILILAVTGLTIAAWSVVALVDNLRHDSAARPPRSHRPDSFDPAARWQRTA